MKNQVRYFINLITGVLLGAVVSLITYNNIYIFVGVIMGQMYYNLHFEEYNKEETKNVTA
jgi:hypothetical protein